MITKKILIIGAGIGGLAVGCRLAACGHRVEILEKTGKAGGKYGVFDLNGCKFDCLPMPISTPYQLDEIFLAAGARREDYFSIIPIKPYYRIFDGKKKYVDFSANDEAMGAQIEQRNRVDRIGYLTMTRSAENLLKEPFDILFHNRAPHFWEWLEMFFHLMQLNANRSVYEYVAGHIEDIFIRQMLAVHPLVIGANPWETTSLYALPWFEREYGLYYPLGGNGAVINGLIKLFGELGGKIHYNQEVVEILIRHHSTEGVRFSNDRINRSDVVISAADSISTLMGMIHPQHRFLFPERRLKAMHYGASFFVLYLATRRKYQDSALLHQNIIFNGSFNSFTGDVFSRGKLPRDMVLFINIPSVNDENLGQPDFELFQILLPVPNLKKTIDWPSEARGLRDKIVAYLEKNYLPELRSNIVAEHYITPHYFAKELNCYSGAPFSLQPLLGQLGWLRPPHRLFGIQDVYLTGSGTHPGFGLPGILASAKYIEEMVMANS